MKKQVFMAVYAFCTIVFTSFVSASNPANIVTPPFELRRVGNEFAAFKLNNEGKVTEYFLIQGATWNITETTIANAVYTEGSDITLLGNNGVTYTFSLLQSGISVVGNLRKEQAFGIAHYGLLNGNSITLTDAQARALGGGGGGAGCDTKCLSGGCGTTSCSREIGPANCEVSCNSGYFACCGDLLDYGCKCVSNSCCGTGIK